MDSTSESPRPAPRRINAQSKVLSEAIVRLGLDRTGFQQRIVETAQLYQWSKQQQARCWEIFSRSSLTSEQLFVGMAILTQVHLPKYVYRDFLTT